MSGALSPAWLAKVQSLATSCWNILEFRIRFLGDGAILYERQTSVMEQKDDFHVGFFLHGDRYTACAQGNRATIVG